MQNKKYKIGIDARMYSIPGGIGRYTRELINGLEKIDQENDYVVFIDRDGFDNYKPQNKNFKKVISDVGWYGLSEQIKMPRIWRREGLDLIHFTHFNKSIFYRKPYVVTIHDLTYSVVAKEGMRISKLPPLVYLFKYFVYEIVIKDTIKKAKLIIVPSFVSKKDILSQYKINKDKVEVTYESADKSFSTDEKKSVFSELSDRFGIKRKKYFIYVGNASPHKNLDRLVRAFDIVVGKNKDFHLVLAGKKDKFYASLQDRVLKENIGDGKIVFTDVVTDDELKALLSNSYAFVFPSLAEGFGIPPLEAMASGTPVLTSAISCLPEICENAALYFNPYLESSIAEKMMMIIEGEKMRDRFIENGLSHIKKFSWEKMAKETRDAYLKVLDSSK